MGDVYQNVLRRFEQDDLSDDEEEEENVKKNQFGMTKDMKFEFKMAFKAVAGENKGSVPKSQVYDVIQAMGFTFQDQDIADLLENCIEDDEGNYSMETLLDAFDYWIANQFNPDELTTVFNMLAVHERILPEFPPTLDTAVAKKTNDLGKDVELRISEQAIENCLNSLLNKSGEGLDRVTKEEVDGIINEITTTSDRQISYNDFIAIFKT